MVFPIAGGNESKGFEVSNSLRFNAGDSAKLTRTQTAGNRKTFTFSGWIKRSRLGDRQSIISSSIDGSNESFLWFDTADELFAKESNEATFALRTNRKFRDPSAWYHIVYAVDTTQGTAGNRVRIYVNGVEETSFADETQPSQNDDTRFNDNTKALTLGFHVNDYPEYFGGYAAEYNFIDGSAKTPTDFGEFDDNGVWIPKKYTGSYGTNGFYLEFQQTGTSANSSGIGADTSGNDNHFTPTNLAATDITEDTCTNNFATLNPLFRSNFDNDGTYAEGNCERDFTADNANRGYGFATQGVTSGKWYWEIKIPTVARANTGIGDGNAIAGFSGVMYDEDPSKGFMVNYNGQIEENATATSYANSLSDNDIVMWALDMDNHRAYYGINGTWQDSGDPTSGSTGTGDVTTQISDQSHLNTGEPMFPFCFDASTSGQSKFQWNFGNAPFSISSGNTDGKYGNFEYAPPSGYYALCTKRLAEFG